MTSLRAFQLRDDQVYNNIQKYGNTTAASIIIALSEAWGEGKVNKGDLVVLAAFGSGFTWASAIIRRLKCIIWATESVN